jgi:hypothetical protein
MPFLLSFIFFFLSLTEASGIHNFRDPRSAKAFETILNSHTDSVLSDFNVSQHAHVQSLKKQLISFAASLYFKNPDYLSTKRLPGDWNEGWQQFVKDFRSSPLPSGTRHHSTRRLKNQERSKLVRRSDHRKHKGTLKPKKVKGNLDQTGETSNTVAHEHVTNEQASDHVAVPINDSNHENAFARAVRQVTTNPQSPRAQVCLNMESPEFKNALSELRRQRAGNLGQIELQRQHSSSSSSSSENSRAPPREYNERGLTRSEERAVVEQYLEMETRYQGALRHQQERAGGMSAWKGALVALSLVVGFYLIVFASCFKKS